MDNAVEWYWPKWAAEAELPVFRVRDTESSHGRYADDVKWITVKDLVKFHGHACDGLFRGAFALSVAFSALFKDEPIDRTDLRVISRNSPCLGDVAAYLSGGRIRFNTQDVRNGPPGVWYIIQRISRHHAVRVTEDPALYPTSLQQMEAHLLAHPDAAPDDVDRLQEAQWQWVQQVLLTKTPQQSYHLEILQETVWPDVPYAHKGQRTDVLLKNIPRT
ncbi:formylmethanofuran dehydrogenase subunit E family protein [Sulfobacillus thermosulfidooxidans]|uniref:formylmethanofuran dehydrogenase subunit E family protein n=1 Tax=Sulfobacillus thermosulfidooxidans TaxID=28034 RepID=UPI00096BAF1D|nr:formylmethanofuran dehydrogenase subunit E family protein [Sulfobacillus thermosulfidooxidans]OLZ11217.1 hypothetical protein BFX05_08025 [Sulfobacillus thermosulfidooxidans]OLZ13444.1 hypothetical protein BFX06_09740 [Sulfobacillus thermosulfidooxidans]OLZ21691.1 hypothetical protein BFX07_12790 [Sulfobacillus thermosulfidooxidans]